jgi:hypothetical protein
MFVAEGSCEKLAPMQHYTRSNIQDILILKMKLLLLTLQNIWRRFEIGHGPLYTPPNDYKNRN